MNNKNLNIINAYGFLDFVPEDFVIYSRGCLRASKPTINGFTLNYYKTKLYDEEEVLGVNLVNVTLSDADGNILGYTSTYVLKALEPLDLTNEEFMSACDGIDESLYLFSKALHKSMEELQEHRNQDDYIKRVVNICECFYDGELFYIDSLEVKDKHQNKGYGQLLLSEMLRYLDTEFSIERTILFDSNPLKYKEDKLIFNTKEEQDLFLMDKLNMSNFLSRYIKKHYKNSFYVGLDKIFEINKCTWELDVDNDNNIVHMPPPHKM